MKEKIMYSAIWMQVLLCLSVATIETHDDTFPLCFYLKTPIIRQINVTVGSLLDGNTTERCSKATDSCYILWQEDPKNKNITIISQGCWNDMNQKCKESDCVPSRSTKAMDNTHFCCCEGNFCNTNITDAKSTSEIDLENPDKHFLGNMSEFVLPIITPILLVGVFLILFLSWYLNRHHCGLPKRSNESLHLMEAPPPPASFDLDTLKIGESIARGRYGSVYKGSLDEQSVAVKIFTQHNHQHFLNERAIYLLPHMVHPSLSKFIGTKEQLNDDGRLEYLLVLPFSPQGCLQNHLRENTYDWNTMCKMTLSVARGLAHLHSEIRKADKCKPCVVHRDVTSRNILMKPDGTCMLCDFGFAIQISGSTYIHNGVEVKAEETSLADVGTLRYMSPEILEGAVNLRDCESSLKQTDVYALGLVIWEAASRCSDLFQGVEVPPYKLPYEAEVGNDPTMEQMQTLVVRRKSRPLFPDIWKTTNPAIQSLKETIEDCWDQDAEARLTALCVEERLTELPVLWEREKAGLHVSIGFSPVCNLKKSSSYHNKSCNDCDYGSESMDDRIISPRERANSLSECTAETLISPSDSIAQANDKNRLMSNSGSPQGKITYPLQPHQGRNPCMARNLMQHDQQQELADLVNGSLKYPIHSKISFSDGDANIFNLPPGLESNLVVSNPNHGSHRVPIPFVQNAVNFNNVPKQTNLLGNKQQQVKSRRWNPLSFFDKKSFRASLKLLLDRKTSASSGYIPEEQQPLKSSSTSPPGERQGENNPFWSPTEPVKDVEVVVDTPDGNAVMKSYDHHLLNGHAISVNDAKVNRPTTLPVQQPSLDQDSESELAKEVDLIQSASNPVCNSSEDAPIRRKGSNGKKRGSVKRVKTPFEIKSRFSLYDDRIMYSQELPGFSNHQDINKLSASVPQNMNCLSLPVDAEDRLVTGSNPAPHNVYSLCDI